MKYPLFNVHDQVLVLTAGAFLLLAYYTLMATAFSKQARYFGATLAGWMALTAVQTLFEWSEALRGPTFFISPYIHLFFAANRFLAGPLLLGYTLSEYHPGVLRHRSSALHLLPVFLAPAYLYWACFQYDRSIQTDLILNYGLYRVPHAYYHAFISLGKLLPVIYAGACTAIILRHRQPLSTPARGRASLLVTGLAFIWLWQAMVHFVGRANNGWLSDTLGIAGNYVTLAFATTLLFQHARDHRVRPPAQEQTVNPRHVARVTQVLHTEHAFLNPQLTLERFAAQAGIAPRDVSKVINRVFHQSFHELINGCRVEEAKRLLRDPQRQRVSIGVIAALAGFNSKATFNRFFKRRVSLTPSEYRDHHQPTGGL